MKKKKKQNNSIKIKIIQKTIGQKWTHMCIYRYLSSELLFNTLETAVALNHLQCHNARAQLPTSRQ